MSNTATAGNHPATDGHTHDEKPRDASTDAARETLAAAQRNRPEPTPERIAIGPTDV